MKISKLFHWLYATLMFLPLMFFIPSIIYFAFNEHATNSETTTINYKYQSNDVNTFDDLVEGNIYEFTTNNYGLFNLVPNDDDYLALQLLTPLEFDYEHLAFDDSTPYFTYFEPSMFLRITNYSSYCGIDLYFSYEQYIDYDYSISYLYDSFFLNDCVIKLIEYQYADLEDTQIFFEYTDYNVIESVEVNTDNTIPQQVSRAWDSIWQLPLFSWTHNSFVSEPFGYITGLFGVPADSTLNYVFAYFVSISICWLVFDLVMWVPNLAHRWLDRSSLQ